MALWQRWVSDNPVLRYHLFGQTRLMARRPIWQIVIVTAPLTLLYIWLVYRVANDGLPELVVTLECLALWLLAPLMTHSVFAMEFEKATWDMLILTRLTAGQIVMGKFLSRLALLGIFVFLFMPLLWIAAAHDFTVMSPFSLLFWVLKTQLVIVGWAILLIAVTLWLSYWLKRGMIAAAVAFAGQVLMLFILPVLWSLFLAMFYASIGRSFDPFYFRPEQESWLHYGWMMDPRFVPLFYNPVFALVGLWAFRDASSEQTFILWGTWQGIVYLLLTSLFIAVLLRSVSKATKKPI